MNEDKIGVWVRSLFLALDELRELLVEISGKLDRIPEDSSGAWWEN